MRFRMSRFVHLPAFWLILFIALSWLVLISWLHWHYNFEHTDRQVIRMGYMPVVTNLAAPLLDYASRDGNGLRFEALKFSSFAEMGEAIRNGNIEAAFIIAPLAIVLHQQGAGVRIVYIGNRHESTLVYRKDLEVKSFADLAGKTIAVPMRFSGHNVATRRLAQEFGLFGNNLNIVEMNPPDMASALGTGGIDAYFVGEPFAAKAVHAGEAKVLHFVEEVWEGFICNLMIVRQDLIDKHPDMVESLVQGAARAGYWASSHPKEAAEIAAKYWNQPADFVEYVLTTPRGRIVYDRFTPKQDEIQFLADEMVRFKLLETANIAGLVEDKFAKSANLNGITDVRSIVDFPHK
ncbi:MAG: ABC transporter substrate-binding protein [Desulfomonile tiedjei]|nr:ABC transporter substrate-binding protein [Desulfomonile tiedjei]